MTQETNDVNEAMRNLEDVTSENFWEKREAYRAWHYQQAWRDLRWYSVGSLVSWLMLRLFLCGAVYAASAFGWLVILSILPAKAGVLPWETTATVCAVLIVFILMIVGSWWVLRSFLLLHGAMCAAAAVGWLVILDARFADGELLAAGGLTWATAGTFWIGSALLLFLGWWGVRPWQSPVARRVAQEMDRWWDQHGDKLPVSEANKA